MASFQVFLPLLLRFEGGFVDDPADPGGATNKGITLQTFQAHARQLLAVAPTLENLKNLSDAQAGTLYKALYWDRARGEVRWMTAWDTTSEDVDRFVSIVAEEFARGR